MFGSGATYLTNLPTEVDPAIKEPYEQSVNALASALHVRILVAVVGKTSSPRADRYATEIRYESDGTGS